MKFALLVVLSFLGSVALADHHGEGKDGKDRPCKKIHEACEAAGFKKGGHKDGKGLHMDCMKKLASGESVAGVTVDQADVASCKAKWADHKGKHMHKEHKADPDGDAGAEAQPK
jgi:hypothetical protein